CDVHAHAHGVGHAPVPRAVGLQAGTEAGIRRRALRLEDDGRKARRPAREDAMNWNKWIRQIHRWLAIVFTVTVIITFVALQQQGPVWVSYIPLPPLFLLLFTGLYLFVLPYATRWRGGQSVRHQNNLGE